MKRILQFFLLLSLTLMVHSHGDFIRTSSGREINLDENLSPEKAVRKAATNSLRWVLEGDFGSIFESTADDLKRTMVWEAFWNASFLLEVYPNHSLFDSTSDLIAEHN